MQAIERSCRLLLIGLLTRLNLERRASAGYALTIRTKSQCADSITVTLQRSDLQAGRQIPEPQRLVG